MPLCIYLTIFVDTLLNSFLWFQNCNQNAISCRTAMSIVRLAMWSARVQLSTQETTSKTPNSACMIVFPCPFLTICGSEFKHNSNMLYRVLYRFLTFPEFWWERVGYEIDKRIISLLQMSATHSLLKGKKPASFGKVPPLVPLHSFSSQQYSD